MTLPWIQLVDGRPFEPGNPKKEDFDINVIANSLSNICSFGGNTKRYNSVAEHSVHVAIMLTPHLRIYGLLHDAHEAYTGFGDVCNPMKLEGIRAMEKNIDTYIAQAFGLERDIFYSPEVKHADLKMLHTEKLFLLEPCEREWELELPVPNMSLQLDRLRGDPRGAEDNFLNLFWKITNGK